MTNPAILPPYAQISDFLDDEAHARLSDWVIENGATFTPAVITNHSPSEDEHLVDPAVRIALVSGDVGDALDLFRAQIVERMEEICERAGYRGPKPTSIELEIAAHGDGAFFRPHVDIPTGGSRPSRDRYKDDRVLSLVYYFHRLPKAFSGGELRLFGPLEGRSESGAKLAAPSIDIDPIDNSLVAFPSWLVHEVRPVRCRSRRFEDYRFAVNCWLCREVE